MNNVRTANKGEPLGGPRLCCTPRVRRQHRCVSPGGWGATLCCTVGTERPPTCGALGISILFVSMFPQSSLARHFHHRWLIWAEGLACVCQRWCWWECTPPPRLLHWSWGLGDVNAEGTRSRRTSMAGLMWSTATRKTSMRKYVLVIWLESIIRSKYLLFYVTHFLCALGIIMDTQRHYLCIIQG